MKKKFFFILGILSLILGFIGIFLPLMPTTPFLLVSAYCFNRSSEKLYKVLTENKFFGQYIKDYQEKRGITLKNKIIAISTLSISICFSIIKIPNLYLKLLLIFILIGVSLYIIRVKTITRL